MIMPVGLAENRENMRIGAAGSMWEDELGTA
jgi:hypothetical protein